MRAVLYTHDMIPITVMDVPPEWMEFMKRHNSMMLAVAPRDLDIAPDFDSWIERRYQVQTVRIEIEPLIRRGEIHWMLFTADEESALLLRSAFLPGQLAEVQAKERAAFARGFFKAILP